MMRVTPDYIDYDADKYEIVIASSYIAIDGNPKAINTVIEGTNLDRLQAFFNKRQELHDQLDNLTI